MIESFKEFFDVIIRLILSVQWYDIADIILVAMLIYYGIKMLRQTRAFNLIKGVVFVGVIYLLVSAFNLSATTFLFNKLFTNIFFVLVLLFQPEIRHAIESFGRGDLRKISLFNLWDNDDNNNLKIAASNIAKAATNMSEKKIGALIVIEGRTPLGEICSTGTQVNSDVSVPVIENIFFPKAPLHDGAVVVKDGRIHSAGCILPLTKSDDVRLELGTRHRAALGMSENSDALVLVVSEETGTISIAEKGELHSNLNFGEISERLTKHLVTEENDRLKAFRLSWRKK